MVAASIDAANSGCTRSKIMVEQLARILAILEKAVQDEPQPGIELGTIDPGAEQEIANHEADHIDQCRGRGLQRRQALERRIAFAAEPQDLAVKVLLAREMAKQQRLGDARRLRELLGGGAGKPLRAKSGTAAATIAFRRSSLSNLVFAMTGEKVSAYLHSVKRRQFIPLKRQPG